MGITPKFHFFSIKTIENLLQKKTSPVGVINCSITEKSIK